MSDSAMGTTVWARAHYLLQISFLRIVFVAGVGYLPRRMAEEFD